MSFLLLCEFMLLVEKDLCIILVFLINLPKGFNLILILYTLGILFAARRRQAHRDDDKRPRIRARKQPSRPYGHEIRPI